MLRMPGVWLRLPVPAQLFLPAGGRFSDAVLLPQVCIKEVMKKGKQHEEISVTFIPVGSQTYQLKGTEKPESFNAHRLHLKAVPFVLYSKSAVVDIYNGYKHTLTQFLHVCMKKCLRYQYSSLRRVLY